MISPQTVRQMAMTFEGVEELPHFEKPSFRVKKKIFATLDLRRNRACLKLSEMDQDIYALPDRSVIYPVPNKWGQQGWTYVELKTVRKDIFKEAISSAYHHVSHKR